jgi:hypothetical protein
MTCPAVIEVVTPGPPGPGGSGSTVITGPALLGRAEATLGHAGPILIGSGLAIVNGALTAAGATDLSYDPATRLLGSSTGADVTLPLVSTTAAGLVPSGWLTGAEAAILPHIHGALAGPVYEHVRNDSGATMAALTPYHVVGSQGDTDRVKIVPADPGIPGSMPASGILAAALDATGTAADGHGAVSGVITGVNTGAWPSGTLLYVAVGGGLTDQPPAAGVQAIGVVGRSHASTGTLALLMGPELGNSALRSVGNTAGTVADGATVAALQARLDQFRDAATFYVSKKISASDSNNGGSDGEPFLTIGAAVAAANAYTTANPGAKAKIFVGPGRFVEPALPLRLKPNILIQGALQRATTIQPAAGQELNSFLAVDSGCMICDLTFAGHQAQNTSPTDSTVGTRAWAITFNEQANGGTGVFLTASPYIKDCLSLTAEDDAGLAGSTSTGDCGGGVEVDGAKCAPNSPVRSMMVYGFTQQNLGGPGAIIKNEGYAELVSFFGLFGTWHVRVETGGQATMSGGGCSEFGTYGLVADGYSPTAIFTGALLANAAQGATTVDIGSLSANRIGSASRPGPGQLMLVAGTVYVVQSATPITGGFRVGFFSPTGIGLAAAATTGAAVNFRLRSQINAGCHTVNYVGSGTNYSALPWNGGVPIRANETVETNFGRVFGATLNDVGDFKIAGGAFAVDGTTGSVTINTSSFNLSGLNAIGPFSRNGGISTVGVQLQELSNNINLLASTGVSDGNTAPTQFAVRTYANNSFLQGLSVTANQPLTLTDTSTTDAQGFQVRNRNLALTLNAANGLAMLDGAGLLPVSLLNFGTTAPANLGAVAAVGTSANPARQDHVHRFQPADIVIPLTGDRQTLWVDTVMTIPRWPRDHILETIPLWSVNTAATGATIQLDIRVAGVSIFATLPTIDAGELGSDTAAVPATFSAAFTTAGFRIARLSVVTFHVLQVGISPNTGKGLKVAIPARRAAA